MSTTHTINLTASPVGGYSINDDMAVGTSDAADTLAQLLAAAGIEGRTVRPALKLMDAADAVKGTTLTLTIHR